MARPLDGRRGGKRGQRGGEGMWDIPPPPPLPSPSPLSPSLSPFESSGGERRINDNRLGAKFD